MQHDRRSNPQITGVWVAACALGLILSGSAAAATLTTLHSFCIERFCPDGLDPANGLLRDAQGNLYGETTEGGAFGSGTVFQLYRPPGKTKFKVRVLHDFCSFGGSCGDEGAGAGHGGHLIIDSMGNIYGTANGGGVHEGGLAFRLTPHNGGKRWSYRVLYDFCAAADCTDGMSPASLTYAGAASGAPYDGVSPLYGVAEFGGKNGKGVAFRLTPRPQGRWPERVLHDFCAKPACADGANPAFDLLLDANGDLFGVTTDFDIHNPGAVFKLSRGQGSRWNETVLHTFCSSQDCADGQTPGGGLVMDAAGNLFGVTHFGGNPICRAGLGCGVAYKITPRGEQSVLYSFCGQANCTDGAEPSGRLALDDGANLYGTTFSGGARQGGTLFRLNGDGHQVLFDFCSGACGSAPSEPTAGVILDPDKNLLGTAAGGQVGVGTVYQVTP